MDNLTPIEKKQREIREMENDYIKAKEYVNGGARLVDTGKALGKIRALVVEEGYKTDGEANYLLGRLRQIFEDLDSPLQIITNYERIKKSLDDEVARKR